jgi:beta-aspartyl-dipeptidase (metallo-type)
VYWESGAPLDRVTVSSDGGGCLPVFDLDGRVVSMGVGDCSALMRTVAMLSSRGHFVSRVIAPFTSTPASLLRLNDVGRLALGKRAETARLA